MYDVIVAGTDGSATAGEAVRHAAELAALSGAALHLVTGCHLVDAAKIVGAVAASNYLSGPAVAATGNAEIDSARQALESAAAPLRERGLDVRTWPVAGAPAEAILDVATAQGADLIVVGSRGMARRILGSVPNSVAHKATCAVLVVKTD